MHYISLYVCTVCMYVCMCVCVCVCIQSGTEVQRTNTVCRLNRQIRPHDSSLALSYLAIPERSGRAYTQLPDTVVCKGKKGKEEVPGSDCVVVVGGGAPLRPAQDGSSSSSSSLFISLATSHIFHSKYLRGLRRRVPAIVVYNSIVPKQYNTVRG